MRTRHNNKVINIVSRPATAYNYVNVKCDGSSGSGSATSAVVNSSVAAAREERMTDSLGKGSSHACTHRIYRYSTNSGLTAVVYGTTTSGQNCVQSYNLPLAWYENNDGIRSYHGWSADSNTSVPPFWTLSLPGNENILKEDVIERARQLKADALLNYAEANQLLPAVSTLASNIPVMERRWWNMQQWVRRQPGWRKLTWDQRTDKVVGSLAVRYSNVYLAWKFGLAPLLSDIHNVYRYLPQVQREVKRHANQEAQRFSRVAEVPAAFTNGDYQTSMQNGFTTVRYSHIGKTIESSPQIRTKAGGS
jgi:hypothetical protein